MVNLWHAVNRIWTSADPEFKPRWIKLCSCDIHYTMTKKWFGVCCIATKDKENVLLWRKPNWIWAKIEFEQLKKIHLKNFKVRRFLLLWLWENFIAVTFAMAFEQQQKTHNKKQNNNNNNKKAEMKVFCKIIRWFSALIFSALI